MKEKTHHLYIHPSRKKPIYYCKKIQIRLTYVYQKYSVLKWEVVATPHSLNHLHHAFLVSFDSLGLLKGIKN